jgi:predicted anti-sigma-YlaC factor YlaD
MLHISAATLDAYYTDGLPAPEARLVRNHLVWCTDCRRTVLQMQSLARLLRSFEGPAAAELIEKDGAAG